MARLQSLAAVAAAAAAAVVAALLYKRKCGRLTSRVRELEDSLADAVEKAAAERRGKSCFSTRNCTLRQLLVVPLARATVVLNPSRVPAEGLEGLTNYSHCWILYAFHLNTDLIKCGNTLLCPS